MSDTHDVRIMRTACAMVKEYVRGGPAERTEMDPDVALRTALEASARVIATEGAEAEAAVELAESVQALHEWIARGGFLPVAWGR